MTNINHLEKTNPQTFIEWEENQEKHQRVWMAERGNPPPSRIEVIDDTCNADRAYRLACEGTFLLWRGDYQNARQLLQAMDRRFNKKPFKPTQSIKETFHRYRMRQAQRAKILGMLLIPIDENHHIELKRAPDVEAACQAVYGQQSHPYVLSLRELLGLIGAHQWRIKGVWIEAIKAKIHPHYGVFSPVRGEYLSLLANAPLPKAIETKSLAMDIGTGTGILAAILAKRGVKKILATDSSARALACAKENVANLGFEDSILIEQKDLFPDEKASLIVCNPPWLPGKPATLIEEAIYDQDSRMLKAFLNGLADHLLPGGEGWLIISNLAECLDLRAPDELTRLIDKAGLELRERHDVKPIHLKASDKTDPLYFARSKEITSLWRLAVRG